MGFRIGQTIEDATTRAAADAERDATAPLRALARDIAKSGVPKGGVKLEGKSVVPTPGETVIQRANTFTNYAGRSSTSRRTTRASSTPGRQRFTGRTLALSFAGADGVFGAATNMGVFIGHRPERPTTTCTTGSWSA